MMKGDRAELVIFDLDFTLWNAGGTWCDCLIPPFSRKDGLVLDSSGRRICLYEDVREILDYLDREGIDMAIASRTEEPSWAKCLLRLLEIEDRFFWSEIYPSSKVKRFERLRQQSSLSFESMVFFDDEWRNIEEVGALGVRVRHVSNGLDWSAFRKGRTGIGPETIRMTIK